MNRENGFPSGLREQLAAWHSAYCPEGHEESFRHRSVLVPVMPGGSSEGPLLGSCAICKDCGAILLGDEACIQCTAMGAAASDEEKAMAGRLLGGRWRLIEPVGGGSFGTFWRGEHHILGMKVGIKILRRHLTATPAGLKLFHMEAMRVSLLNHPGIVKLFDYGEDAGVPYLVMEYLSGKPLHELLGGRLELDDCIEVVCQATKALISAHRGTFTDGDPLAHLDLKPEHIFIEKIEGGWHVKVIDFGLAEIAAGPGSDSAAESECPRKHVVAGTPPYMGPERFQGVVDPRSDLYSLGVILYQCVAGRKPFECEDAEEYRAAHEHVVPVPPSRHAGRSASRSLRRLDSLILWTLSKELRDRPQSAEVFLDALETWKRRTAAETEARRWSSRARRWTAVSLACAVPVLFLLWASPLGRVDLDDPGLPPLLILSRSSKGTVSGRVRGIGYVDASVFLEVVLDDGELRVRLGSVEGDGAFQVQWPGESQLREKLGAERVSHGKEFRAAVVSSRLGRSLRSLPFTVKLDYEPPRILAIEEAGGSALKTQATEDGLRVFAVDGAHRLVLRASEPLDLESSRIRGKAPAGDRDDGDSIPLDLRGGKESLECLLVDRAGNDEGTWIHLHPVREVSFSEPETDQVLTRAPEVILSVAVEGDLGFLRILVDDRQVWGKKESKAEYRVQLSEPRQTRKVVLRAWSVLSDPSDPPDRERTVTIERLDRRIEVVASREGKGIPRLRVLDAASREEVPGARIQATASRGGERGKSIRCEDGAPVLPPDMRGMLQCGFTATDAYGNASEQLLLDILHPDRPVITSLEIVGDLGTEDLPLHSADCSCRPLDGEGRQQLFTLEAALDYDHLEDLRAEIARIRTDGTPSPLFTGRGHRFEISQADLLRVLEPGENSLELSVFDSRDPESRPALRDSMRVSVHVARLDLTVYPTSDTPPLDSRGRVNLTIDARGAGIDGVLVKRARRDPSGKPAMPIEGSVGEYSHDLPVSYSGYTSVFIEAQADGRTHGVERKYRRPPVEGIDYVFPVELGAGLPLLRLRFHRTSAEGQAFGGFWFSGVELGEALDRAFREKAPERSSPAGGGVTRAQVEHALRQLEKELKEKKWIGPSQRVRLPTASELRMIGDPAPRREWLQPERGDLESGKWSALHGTVSAEGITLRGADENDPSHLSEFRVVLDYGVPDSRLDPCEARAR